jgi:hypothetical protein
MTSKELKDAENLTKHKPVTYIKDRIEPTDKGDIMRKVVIAKSEILEEYGKDPNIVQLTQKGKSFYMRSVHGIESLGTNPDKAKKRFDVLKKTYSKPYKETSSDTKVTIEKSQDGEFRVPAQDGFENGAYYTTDRKDAISTCVSMYKPNTPVITFRTVTEFVGGKYEKYRPGTKKTTKASAGNVSIQAKLLGSIKPTIDSFIGRSLNIEPVLAAKPVTNVKGVTLVYETGSTPTDAFCLKLEAIIEKCITALYANNESKVTVDSDKGKLHVSFYASVTH